jgi:hypothetical protein
VNTEEATRHLASGDQRPPIERFRLPEDWQTNDRRIDGSRACDVLQVFHPHLDNIVGQVR